MIRSIFHNNNSGQQCKGNMEGRGGQRQGGNFGVTWDTQYERSGYRNKVERNLRDNCDVAPV